MRKIAVVTSSRADYWLLRNLLTLLRDSSNLCLIISGENLEESQRIKILKDGFNPDYEIPCKPAMDNFLQMSKAMATAMEAFAETFNDERPDIVVLLGDRYEIHSAAVAAYSQKIPIAHIHGGEVTSGALDDGFRHSISKLSSLHFVAHDEYKKRLLRMGEQPQRVHVIGSIGIDNIGICSHKDKTTLNTQLNFLDGKDYFLLTLHPDTLSKVSPEESTRAVINALDSFPSYGVVVTKANLDPGGEAINKTLQEWSQATDRVLFTSTLGDDYLKVAAYAKCVVGNSSSGIFEIPYLGVPVINIGYRQKGRIVPDSVYSVPYNAVLIKKSIEEAMLKTHECEMIYGIPGRQSKKIFDILSCVSTEDLVYKRFYDGEK